MVALETQKINYRESSRTFWHLFRPSSFVNSENTAVLNICFDFLVVVAPSSEKSYKFKRTPNVHFISFKVKHYVILCLLIKKSSNFRISS